MIGGIFAPDLVPFYECYKPPSLCIWSETSCLVDLDKHIGK